MNMVDFSGLVWVNVELDENMLARSESVDCGRAGEDGAAEDCILAASAGYNRVKYHHFFFFEKKSFS